MMNQEKRHLFTKNIGPADAWIRGFLGLELILAALIISDGTSGAVSLLIAIGSTALIASAVAQFSPAYAIFGFSTTGQDSESESMVFMRTEGHDPSRTVLGTQTEGGLKISDDQIKLYQAEWCHFAQSVRRTLERLGVAYIKIDVPRDKINRENLFRISGQRGIPTLIDGDVVIADDDEAINAYLQGKYVRNPQEVR